MARNKRNDFRLVEPRLHLGQGAFDVDGIRCRVVGLYVPDDGFEQADDVLPMGIGFDPPADPAR
jgi:hypothetical protein